MNTALHLVDYRLTYLGFLGTNILAYYLGISMINKNIGARLEVPSDLNYELFIKCFSEFIYFDVLDAANPSKYFPMTFATISLCICTPLLCIWNNYEFNCHNRTLINRYKFNKSFKRLINSNYAFHSKKQPVFLAQI